MTKKILIFMCTIIMMFLVLTACAQQTSDKARGSTTITPTATINATDAPVPSIKQNPEATNIENIPSPTSLQEITKLLPNRIDYQWVYNGFAEYAHKMQLLSIDKGNSSYVYHIKGQVVDISDGASKKDFSLSITYTAVPGILTQEKVETNMMDSIYNKIELIRSPLVKGTKWSQKVTDKNGKQATLDCTITDIAKDGDESKYTVSYKDTSGTYYEKRVIKEGVGVISFEKLYISQKDNFPVSYSINSSVTGYIARLNLNSYLPDLNKELRYNGLAEYGHIGTLVKVSDNQDNAVYEFKGVYHDGSGIADKFTVRYYLDYIRGTLTEKAITNTRTKKNEVNSKLHDIVLLKLPIEKGATWNHNTIINGKKYSVRATITEVNSKEGIVKVSYIVTNVAGYYNETYIENRTFQIRYGLTGFSNIMPGKLSIDPKDINNKEKLQQAIDNHMFGYSLSIIQ